MQDKIFCLYKCAECVYPCVTSNKTRHSCDNPVWVEQYYQITKKPEPVWILDIPEQLLESIERDLRVRNGSNVVIEERNEAWTIFETTRMAGEVHYVSRCWPVPTSWLKQKQPEPTAEEELQKKISIINKIASAVYNDSDLSLLRGKIKRIMAGEE